MGTLLTSSKKTMAVTIAALTVAGASLSLGLGASNAFAAANDCGTAAQGMSFEVLRMPQSTEDQEYLFYAENTSWTFTRTLDGETLTVNDNVGTLSDRHDHSLNQGRFCFVNHNDDFFVEGGEYTVKQSGVTAGSEPATVGLVEYPSANVPNESWARLDKTAVPFTWTFGGNLNDALLESLNHTVNDTDNYYVLETSESSVTWYVETEDGTRVPGTVWNVYPDDDKYEPYDPDTLFTVTDNDSKDKNPEVGAITLAYPDVKSFYKVYIQQKGGAPEGYLVADEDPEGSLDANNDGYGTVGINNWGEERPSEHLTFIMKKAQTLAYDGNGAQSGEIAGVQGAPDSTTPVAQNAFEREGYTFEGWNTAADGSGDAYAPGDTFTFTAGETILYAQWEEIPAVTEPESEPEQPTKPEDTKPEVPQAPEVKPSAAPVTEAKIAAPVTGAHLATTGSNVAMIAIAAAALLTAGLVFMVKRRS